LGKDANMLTQMKKIVPRLSQATNLALLFQAVECAHTGVVVTDPSLPDNPMIYANPAFCEITGYPIDEILGKNCRFLQGNDHDQPLLQEVRKAIKEETNVTVVLRNYKKNGSLFYNELLLSPVYDEYNKLIAFVGIQNDITARVEANARVADFYSMISHELRTPITSLKGTFSILAGGRAGELSERAVELVSLGLKETDRLIRLINNILDMKKIEAGKFDLTLKNLRPQELVEQTIISVKAFADQYNVGIIAEVNANDLIKGDRDRLIQILTNLISNAIKFSDSGQTVTVKTLRRDNNLRFCVTDTGPGIDPRNVPKLFRMFPQIDSPNQPKGGTGLGLAICKSLVEEHGGSLGIETTLGQGSTFWFEIPCA